MGNLSIRTMLGAALVTLLAGGVTAQSAFAVGAEGKPLLVPGKQSIYERVLLRPGAQLVTEPDGTEGMPLAAFSRFYVYERREIGGQERLLVGSGSDGKTDGWVAADTTIPWRQQMALAFTNPSNRARTLLFKDRDSVLNVVLAEDPGVMVAPIREAALGAEGDSRVVSVEPETYIDITEKFYLLPILEAEEVASHRGYQRLLKVASVTAASTSGFDIGAGPAISGSMDDSVNGELADSLVSAPDSGMRSRAFTTEPEPTAPASGPMVSGPTMAEALKSYSSAVVFVIDSTISMGPYIDRTREAVRQIYDKIAASGLLDQVRFGLVAYRSNIEAAPKLEYVERFFADPSDIRGGEEFLKKVEDLRPAEVSSPRFDEDAYAGVMAGLDEVSWHEFGGRYLVLITDAGALDAENPLSKWKVGAEQVRIEAEQLGVAIYALHLKTPQGVGNHPSAEQQYRDLTQNAVVGRSLYYPVGFGAVDEFGRGVDALAESIVEQVRAARAGLMADAAPTSEETIVAGVDTMEPDSAPLAVTETASDVVPNPPRASMDTPLPVTVTEPVSSTTSATDAPEPVSDLAAQIKSDTALLGHAMQLAYLGRVQGTEAPKVFEAWLCDRDFANPEIATTEVRVLLTKNELSNLRDVVQAILDAGEEAQEDTGTADFFDLLRSSAAHLARDPSQITNPEATKLGELGLLGEYLDDLPYRSDVMNLTSDIWEQWSMTQQEEFLDGLRRKLRHYQIYHDDADRWVSLASTAVPGENVYPVPLQALP